MVALGGGRARAGDAIDVRVGLGDMQPIGTRLDAGDPLLRVHARTPAEAEAALRTLTGAITIADEAPRAEPVIRATRSDAADRR